MSRLAAVTSKRETSQSEVKKNLGKSKFNTVFPLRSTKLCGFRVKPQSDVSILERNLKL